MGDKTKVSDILEELELLQKLKDAETTRLKSELERVKKIAHELADFYGNENNWSRSNKALFTRINCTDVDIAKNKEVRQVYYSHLEVGGKLARTKKKELEEL